MYLLNGKPLVPGQQFTAIIKVPTPVEKIVDGETVTVTEQVEDEVQYPADWLANSTAEERAALGITEVGDPVRPDDRFHFVTQNEDGTFTATPKPLEPIIAELCRQIDLTADNAYEEIAGNRVAEYQLTEADALAFKAAGYKGDVPLSVQSYVDSSNISPKQATDGILAQAAGMRALVVQIREARLLGKSKVKAAKEAEAAQAAADAARQAINELLNPKKEQGK